MPLFKFKATAVIKAALGTSIVTVLALHLRFPILAHNRLHQHPQYSKLNWHFVQHHTFQQLSGALQVDYYYSCFVAKCSQSTLLYFFQCPYPQGYYYVSSFSLNYLCLSAGCYQHSDLLLSALWQFMLGYNQGVILILRPLRWTPRHWVNVCHALMIADSEWVKI